ncbi:MAG: RNA 2'-phosphotransferase [Candidatus Lokiarchaeota archaeon]|jgi:putative RNA 2'-phosphotransferase
MKRLYTRISKFMSYILRHHPERFNIELDTEGYADLETILNQIRQNFPNYQINEHLIKEIINVSEKRRFEIVGDKIKAFYGHSIKNKIKMQKAEHVPDKLFHGTNSKAFQKIKKEGLKRKSRQYVHLSGTVETAYSVGKRKTENPIILVIESWRAVKEGISFYKSGDMYLADYIPPEYISLYK